MPGFVAMFCIYDWRNMAYHAILRYLCDYFHTMYQLCIHISNNDTHNDLMLLTLYIINHDYILSPIISAQFRGNVINHRSLGAHKFFTSGWVQTVYHKNLTPDHAVFMADVRPSYRVTEQRHHPCVAVSTVMPEY